MEEEGGAFPEGLRAFFPGEEYHCLVVNRRDLTEVLTEETFRKHSWQECNCLFLLPHHRPQHPTTFSRHMVNLSSKKLGWQLLNISSLKKHFFNFLKMSRKIWCMFCLSSPPLKKGVSSRHTPAKCHFPHLCFCFSVAF